MSRCLLFWRPSKSLPIRHRRDRLLRLGRASETGSYGADQNSACIQQWLSEDETQKTERANEINDWWMSKGHNDKTWPLLISAGEFAEERSQFIQAKNIECEGGQ